MKISEIIVEGGHVFGEKTTSIKHENIAPTLNAYFSELKRLFPQKSDIFTTETFVLLGSTGKKEISGDIDLGIDSSNMLDKTISDESIKLWNIDPQAVQQEFIIASKVARTSTPEQTKLKVFLNLLSRYINEHSNDIICHEKKITLGTMFSLFPQITPVNKKLGVNVQIDWMIGNLNWMKFSYYSSVYHPESNVKGLHRTQLLLAAFHIVGLSFKQPSGVFDRETGKSLTLDPNTSLKILSNRLGFEISMEDVENFNTLNDLFKSKMKPEDYRKTLDSYYKTLDSTRIDIPTVLQRDWLSRKNILGLTGKFLPDTSSLKNND